MKREIVVGIAITKEDNEKLRLKLRQWEDKAGKSITISTFIYEALILPYLNENEKEVSPASSPDPSSIPTSEQQSEPPTKPLNVFNFDNI